MSFLGGILKSVLNPATLLQLAMGPAGWASLAVKTIGMAIAQQVIQQIGQRLGLPQSVISMAQTAFSAATGQPGAGVQSVTDAVAQIAQQLNLSPVDQGQMERDANNSVSNLMKAFEKVKKEDDEDGGSFLVRLAKAMGKVMDKKMGQMDTLSKEISALSQKDTKAGSAEANQLGTKNNLLQAYGQELGILSNAFAQISKSVGEAQVTAARK